MIARNLRHLRLFLRVGALNSLTAAADLCNVSQPAATQAIAKREREVAGNCIRHWRPLSPPEGTA